MPNKEPLSKEDWMEWLSLPQTQAFFAAVKSEQEEMLQMVVKVDMDSMKQARAIGIMSGLQKVLDFDYTDGY